MISVPNGEKYLAMFRITNKYFFKIEISSNGNEIQHCNMGT